MNILSVSARAAILRALVEGNSIRSVSRMTGASKNTILRLLVEVGEFCSFYQDIAITGLKCERVEADEIWSYVAAKQKNATQPGQGDCWTYTAVCATSKLAVSWLVGQRNSANTQGFMADVASRMAGRIQITTDGLMWYIAAVEKAFGYNGADFAQIIKQYGTQPGEVAGRYSPAECTGVEKKRVFGAPDMEKVSTSYVERQNLTMRMSMRRFTRLTNGFSKKAENHAHAVSLHFMHYNFCRAHQTLTKAEGGVKTTPAMAAGLTDHVWTVEEILGKMDPENLLQ